MLQFFCPDSYALLPGGFAERSDKGVVRIERFHEIVLFPVRIGQGLPVGLHIIGGNARQHPFCNYVAVEIGISCRVQRDKAVGHYAAPSIYRAAVLERVELERVGEMDAVGADKLAVLVAHLYFKVRYFMVAVRLYGLGREHVAFYGRTEERDCALDAERKLAVRVHHGGEGDVGQREQRPTLAHASGVKMLTGDGHFGACVALAHLYYLCSGVGGEAVALVKKVF